MTTGTLERDAGISRIRESNQQWFNRAWQELLRRAVMAATDNTIKELEFTGEDIRYTLKASVGEPSHPNCWGALIMSAVRARPPVIVATGALLPMQYARSHARKTAVYKFYEAN